MDAQEKRETHILVDAVIRKCTIQPWICSALVCSSRRSFQVFVPHGSVSVFSLCVRITSFVYFFLRFFLIYRYGI